MRLVYRDKECVICLALRLTYRDRGCVCLVGMQDQLYRYQDNSNCYDGSHIINFAHYELVSHCLQVCHSYFSFWLIIKWDARGYAALISDPFTNSANAKSSYASSSMQSKKDPRQINSLENGLLFCLQHNQDYDNFCFAIYRIFNSESLLSRYTKSFPFIQQWLYSRALKSRHHGNFKIHAIHPHIQHFWRHTTSHQLWKLWRPMATSMNLLVFSQKSFWDLHKLVQAGTSWKTWKVAR